MGALSHILEGAGLPTTHISLIRMHTEIMRPPRALWVPFILGRPFGRPNDAEFQHRVLSAALDMLTEPAGPVLRDHSEEAGGDVDMTGMSCPIGWAAPEATGSLGERLTDELRSLHPWYDLAVERQNRTAFGTTGRRIDEVANSLISLVLGESVDTLPDGVALGEHARLLAEDLKAFVTEAASAQPGDLSAYALKTWFWEQTVAGEAIVAAYVASQHHDEASVRELGPTMVPKELRSLET